MNKLLLITFVICGFISQVNTLLAQSKNDSSAPQIGTVRVDATRHVLFV